MRIFLPLTLLAFAALIRADGPADNLVENVRAVPPPGVSISDDVRAELTRGAEKFGRASFRGC